MALLSDVTGIGNIGLAGIPTTVLGTATTITGPIDINAGTIDGTVIGGSTAAAITATTLNATGGGSLTGTWANLGTVTTVDLNGGTIDGTTIGATTPAAVTTTALVATTADINAGTIDGTVIGGTTAAAGSFTTGAFSSTLGVTGAATFSSTIALPNLGGLLGRNAADSGNITAVQVDALDIVRIDPSAFGTRIGGATTFDSTIAVIGAATFSGNVGIGTDSPTDYGAAANTLEVKGATGSGIGALQLAGADAAVRALLYAGGSTEFIINTQSNHGMGFNTNNTRAMTLDTSGNLLVGKTSTSQTTAGTVLYKSGQVYSTASGTQVSVLTRLSNDGPIQIFYKDSSEVGRIGVASNVLTIFATSSANCGIGFYSNSTVRPLNNSGALSDNAIDLGDSGTRWDDIYATNGTIQTSDRNEKQDIEALSDAETAVAVACKGLLRKFRWIDSVEEKGDDARIHFGIIAQDLQAAFAAEGLDAGRYAMFISSTWWETQTEVEAVEAVEFVQAVEAVYDEDGELVSEAVEGVEAVEAKDAYTRVDTFQTLADAPEGATERTRLGVRYPELLTFIIAAI